MTHQNSVTDLLTKLFEFCGPDAAAAVFSHQFHVANNCRTANGAEKQSARKSVITLGILSPKLNVSRDSVRDKNTTIGIISM